MLALHEVRRSLGNWLAITRNRVRGRTYAPHPRRAIFVETSGRCNLACRFCAYEQMRPGSLMPLDQFRRTVDQIVDLGFDFIFLTPMLGEAFADPTLFEKFDLLEREPRIRGYSFYSNFILPDPADIADLAPRPKLDALYISLYGFDAESFALTTRKPAIQFERLLANLDALYKATATWTLPGGLHFNVRTVRSATRFLDRQTPLVAQIKRLQAERGARFDESDEFDSWGGAITPEDVAPLGITLTDGRHLYMRGACTKLFGQVQIKADGSVHACACRDVDGSLVIGNTGQTPLAEILSWTNAAYRRLIEEQMRGQFSANCRVCSMYRSVFDDRGARLDPTLEIMSVEDAIARLDAPQADKK